MRRDSAIRCIVSGSCRASSAASAHRGRRQCGGIPITSSRQCARQKHAAMSDRIYLTTILMTSATEIPAMSLAGDRQLTHRPSAHLRWSTRVWLRASSKGAVRGETRRGGSAAIRGEPRGSHDRAVDCRAIFNHQELRVLDHQPIVPLNINH